jgi:hypothetical protein
MCQGWTEYEDWIISQGYGRDNSQQKKYPGFAKGGHKAVGYASVSIWWGSLGGRTGIGRGIRVDWLQPTSGDS